jgi:hypothetical protein
MPEWEADPPLAETIRAWKNTYKPLNYKCISLKRIRIIEFRYNVPRGTF